MEEVSAGIGIRSSNRRPCQEPLGPPRANTDDLAQMEPFVLHDTAASRAWSQLNYESEMRWSI